MPPKNLSMEPVTGACVRERWRFEATIRIAPFLRPLFLPSEPIPYREILAGDTVAGSINFNFIKSVDRDVVLVLTAFEQPIDTRRNFRLVQDAENI